MAGRGWGDTLVTMAVEGAAGVAVGAAMVVVGLGKTMRTGELQAARMPPPLHRGTAQAPSQYRASCFVLLTGPGADSIGRAPVQRPY
ncbi:MAG: hypothetical protein U0841_23490 [Chloroflexia bacterium]